MKKIKGLDTLRAFAVFFVIIAHMGVWFDSTSPSGKFISTVLIPDGRFGVDLFFVLSGFLITSILLNAKNTAEKTDRISVIKKFFARRTLRIFPIYYLLLFFLFAINYPDVRRYFWYFATYTSNLLPYHTNTWNRYCHTWTLAIEEQFYLLWPWLMIMVGNKYIKYILAAAIATGIVSSYIGVTIQGHMEPFLVFNCFDAFGIGGLYAWSRLNDGPHKKLELVVKVLVIPAFCVYFYWRVQIMRDHDFIGAFLQKTVNSIIAIWLVILVVNNRSRLTEKYLLGNKFLNYIGTISYGIYLYHFPYLGFFFARVNKFLYDITLPHPALNKIIHDSHVDYWIEISIIVGISAISYALIEKPLLNLKKYFNYYEGKRSGV